MSGHITLGGRQYGKTHRMRVLAVLYPQIRLSATPQSKSLKAAPWSFGHTESWVEKWIKDPPLYARIGIDWSSSS